MGLVLNKQASDPLCRLGLTFVGCTSIFRGFIRAIEGCASLFRGFIRAIEGCVSLFRGFIRAIEGCESLFRGFIRATEGPLKEKFGVLLESLPTYVVGSGLKKLF